MVLRVRIESDSFVRKDEGVHELKSRGAMRGVLNDFIAGKLSNVI